MGKTDKEVLELCKSWFEDIMERSNRLTSGNVSHGSMAIHGVAKNYAEYVDEHLHNRWKPTEDELECLSDAIHSLNYPSPVLGSLLEQLKKLREE